MDNPGVDAILTAALSSLGLPVTRLKRSAKADAYLTFQLIVAQDVNPADDETEQTEHLFRVDLFTRQDHVALVKRLKAALRQAGFYGITVSAEFYEDDTGYYHVPLDVKYLEG